MTTPTHASKDLLLSIRLVPVDTENSSEHAILHAQRLICGWGEDRIAIWRAQALRNERAFFWITLPETVAKPFITPPNHHRKNDNADADENDDPEAADRAARESLHPAALTPLPRRASESTTTTTPLLPVGHIAIDRIDYFNPPDPSLTSPDGSILTLTSLFILPTFSSLGLGTHAMRAAEQMAQHPPYGSANCRAVTLGTLCEKYHDRGSAEMRRMWEGIGRRQPARGNVGWYVRQGYRVYKTDVPRYANEEVGGGVKWWDATFLIKHLPEVVLKGGMNEG